MALKRYIAFVMEEYEEFGGWQDVLSFNHEVFRGPGEPLSFDSPEEALEVIVNSENCRKFDLYQIVDIQEGRMVKEGTIPR
ncbi:MAG: hypothetical protein AAB407_03525 [Patescibacteria group bacterium]